MNYLHYGLELKNGDIVQVDLDKQANVRLLDAANYGKYTKGEKHRYYGGLAKVSPIRLEAPGPGQWHLVVDLGGYPGRVTASTRVING